MSGVLVGWCKQQAVIERHRFLPLSVALLEVDVIGPQAVGAELQARRIDGRLVFPEYQGE